MNIIESQKRKEWRSIENIIPFIEEYLQLKNISHNPAFEGEGPDFIFYNGSKSIAIEVTECRPSVHKSKKYNAPARNAQEERICQKFLSNQFLLAITNDQKLNILVDRGYSLNIKSKICDVCIALESHLRAWYNKGTTREINLIRRIRVSETIGKNIVQFNNIARRDPINCSDIIKRILDKNKKMDSYSKNKCDEYWLCIHLPFEENRQSNRIDYGDMLDDFNSFVQLSRFDRICLTSVMNNDLNWLKGNPCL